VWQGDDVRDRLLLVASLLVAIAATVVTVVVLLVVEPTLSPAEAIKTGGFAGGAVVALYAVWLNDRRRRTEEARHELESDKVGDERFVRSVELLGHGADQVRVGAMHALAGLARSTPRYRQTVLDVLCAYLRRPFDHPSYQAHPHDPAAQISPEGFEEADLERQVRLTAQRLVITLLPENDSDDDANLDLDLTGASVEYLNLARRRICHLTARRARFYGITRLSGLRAVSPVILSGATFLGRATAGGARFDGGLSLQGARFEREVLHSNAVVATFADLRTEPPATQIGELWLAEGTTLRGGCGWPLTGSVPAVAPGFQNQVVGGVVDETRP